MSQTEQVTFASKYGPRSKAAVSFVRNEGYTPADILVDNSDTLEDIARKTANCRAIVEAGGSLAVILDLVPADGSMPTGVPEAREHMSLEEAEQWEDFLGGAALPAVDRMKDRAAPESGESKKRRDERRLQAFQTLYDDNTLERENLAWFYKNHPYLIPLITAADKVLGAKANQTNGGKRDPREQAELIAANRLQSSAATRQAAILVEVNRLKGEVAYNLGAVQARRVAMQPEPAEGGRKVTVRYDEIRKARGKEVVGGPRVWNKEGSKGRVQQLAAGLSQAGQKRGRDDNGGDSRAVQRQRTGGVVGTGLAGPSGGGSGLSDRMGRFQLSRRSPSFHLQSPTPEDMEEGEVDMEL